MQGKHSGRGASLQQNQSLWPRIEGPAKASTGSTQDRYLCKRVQHLAPEVSVESLGQASSELAASGKAC
jgi:hypothetical protein